MRVIFTLILGMLYFAVIAQCPDITETNTVPSCNPSCELCSGGKLTVTLKGVDLPHNGKVDYYADLNPGFNPYNGQGIKIGSANILTPNPKCRVCPILLGFMIDACGTESKNEFLIVWTGSGLNTSDFNFDFAPQNNTGGAQNADIGPGGCGITSGNPGLVGGCSAIAVGSNFDLPPNAIWIVFTNVSAFTNYDFTTVCALTCKIYVSASTCDRTIGAFSNFDATPGNRTQVMTITGCSCSTNAMYDVPGSLTGNGDCWAEGSIVNNGCATPSFNQPNYIAANSTIEPFMFTIPASWCEKTYEIVGILNPKPDVQCCMEEFTERIGISVKCPKANSATIEMCETNNGQSVFTLEDANTDVLGGSNGIVEYFKDMAGTMRINSPFTSGSTTIYARIADGNCFSNLVPVSLKVLLLPLAKSTSAEACDDGSGFASFDLSQLERIIKNGNNSSVVQFYLDVNKTVLVTSPYLTTSTTIYATIHDGKCESKPVSILLTVLNKPTADTAQSTSCAEFDGKATFILIDLIQKISSGKTGVTVGFFEDSLATKLISPPFRSGTDTIYAVVSNSKCQSEIVPIFLFVHELNRLQGLSEKICDNGNGQAVADLINITKILKQGDSSRQVKWYADSLKINIINPPVTINGMDTLYAFLTKDSCQSKAIAVILETVSRPSAKSVTISACVDSSGKTNFDLNAIIDSINNTSGLPVLFAEDSLFKRMVNSPYHSSDDTLFAMTVNGNCNSFPVRIYLNTIKSPHFYQINDTTACDRYTLSAFQGYQLTVQAAYYLSPGNLGQPLKPGTDILKSSWVYYFDENNNCIDQDSFKVDIIKGPEAGMDNQISVCEGNLIDLKSHLINADTGGIFLDIDQSNNLSGSIFNSSGLNGGSFTFRYLLNGNSVCPGDSAEIKITVLQKLSAGLDTSIVICEDQIIDLYSLLRNFNPGGQFYDSLNTGALSGRFWDSKISGFGKFNISYETGDGVTCPKDRAYIVLTLIKTPSFIYRNTICKNDTILLGGQIFDRNHLITKDTLKNQASNGCDSIRDIQIQVYPDAIGSFSTTLCSNQRITINGTIYSKNKSSGQEVIPNASVHGCDSIINVLLFFKSIVSSIYSTSICEQDTIYLNGKPYYNNKTSGLDTLLSAGVGGCDSIVRITVTITPPSYGSYIAEICESDSLLLHGKWYHRFNLAGFDTLKSQSSAGCDSIINVNIRVKPKPSGNFIASICQNDTIHINGSDYGLFRSSGTETLKGMASNGCDSILNIAINFKPNTIGNYNASICEHDTLFLHGISYHKNYTSAVDTLSGLASNGCDSIVQIQLKVIPIQVNLLRDTLCQSENLVINGNTYDINHPRGTEKFTSSIGCDSILSIELSFSDPSISYPADITIQPGQNQKILIIPDFNPVKISWSPAVGLSCTDCLNPTVAPLTNMVYTVELTDENGCIVFAQINVKIEINDKTWVPNAFSPNGDNINDLFKVISSDPNLMILDFAIFDRWGNQIYIEQNKTVEEHNGWDGNSRNGEKLNPGVFVYYVRLKIPTGPEKIISGDLSLIR